MKNISQSELCDLLNQGLTQDQHVNLNCELLVISYYKEKDKPSDNHLSYKSDTQLKYKGRMTLNQKLVEKLNLPQFEITSQSGEWRYLFLKTQDFKATTEEIIIKENPKIRLYFRDI